MREPMRLRLLAAAFALLVTSEATAEQFTASGSWSAGKKGGTWSATLDRNGEIISGHIQLSGAPVAKADVGGTLRGNQIEFGVVSTGREVASFDGAVSMNRVGGKLVMTGVTGEWSGSWAATVTMLPVTDERSGALEAPFDRPSVSPPVPSSDPCVLLENGVAAHMSGGTLSALRGMCGARSPSANSTTTNSGASILSSSISCNPGPPESNPPDPSTIYGDLVNNVSRDLQEWPHITQSEVSVGVLPLDNNTRIAVYNDTQFRESDFSGIGWGYQNLASSAWTQNPDQVFIPKSLSEIPVSDPVVAPERVAANFHAAHISATTLGYFHLALATTTEETTVPWFSDSQISVPTANAVVPDKEWLAIDRTGRAGKDGTKYQCWTALSGNTYRIWYARQRPGLLNWDTPVAVSVTRTSPDLVQGCQVAVAPDSSVYVSWWEEVSIGGLPTSGIVIRRSVNGTSFGTSYNASGSFTKATDATATADCGIPALKGHVRVLPFPSLAVDPVGGAVYIAWTRKPPAGSGSQIAFTRSTNLGVTWSTPLVVNDSAAGDKFLPAVAVTDYDRRIRVMWYDRRNDPNNLNIDLYSAVSSNGGASFGANERRTYAAFGIPHIYPNFDCHAGDIFHGVADCYMGDYNGIVGLQALRHG